MFQFSTTLIRLLVVFSWLAATQVHQGMTSQRFFDATFRPGNANILAVSPESSAAFNPTSSIVLLQADNSAPVIDVWYGLNQTFPHGTPQGYVNIVGNVSDPESSITSLAYSLNGSSTFTSLTRGPTRRRLADPGDFNIDIPVGQLSNGANSVLIRAISAGGTRNVTVTVNYNSGPTWPLPYFIDWNSVSNLQQALWVVDGKWQKVAGGIRTTQVAYDRVLAIGDLDWTDYEVLVPITVHAIDGAFYGDSISANPGMGVNLRWTGHTDVPSVCPQPKCGWEPTGASAWYEWLSDADGRLRLFATPPTGSVPTDNVDFGIGGKYWFRVRAVTNASGTLYSVKAWLDGQPEPPNWLLTKQADKTNLDHGSFILVAHHVDVTFGNVSVTPLNQSTTYTLNKSVNGSGSITAVPNKTAYNPGEVVTLTATPATGWSFSNWSGGANGSGNPIQVTMTGNLNVQANFIQNQPDLGVSTYIPLITR